MNTATLPRRGRILSIDWGERRVGLALSDSTQKTAHPLGTMTRRSGKRFPMKQLRSHLERNTVVGIVLGLPLSPEGSETHGTDEVRNIAELIESKSRIPVVLVDERMTTAQALKAVKEMGGSTRGRKEEIDSLAATVLLESYLESIRE